MKVESSMASVRIPVRMGVAASKRKVAIQIEEPVFAGGGIIAITLNRDDARRLGTAILAALEQPGDQAGG